MTNEPRTGATPAEPHRIAVVAAEDETIEAAGVVIERHTPRAPGARAPRRKLRERDLAPLGELRPSLVQRIRQDFPDLPANAMISARELARYRMLYVSELLEQEHGEVSALDRQVAESIAQQDTIAANIEDEFPGQRTFGERLSDELARLGGSWSFLMAFAFMLALWIAWNVWRGGDAAFDPYPFILLNLLLSCLAAVQAPIIMMSQKRQEAKDRLRGLNDYRVNLKAELEIRHLHEKIDYLISRQWQRLAEIQHMQLEIMQEERVRPKASKKTSLPPTEGLDD